MNIVQVSVGEEKLPTKVGGGIEAYVFTISRQLSRMGNNVVLLDRKYSPDDADTECIDGVNIVRLKARRFNFNRVPNVSNLRSILTYIFNQPAFARQVKRYLRDAGDIDVIHVHEALGGFVLAMIDRSVRNKLFYTSHSARRTKDTPSLRDRIMFIPENWLTRWANRAIVLNEVSMKKLIRGAKVRPEKVVMVPHEVDTDTFTLDLDTGDVRQRYGLEGKVVILFVGRICVGKGLEYLVKAANIIVNESGYEQALFLLVGPVDEFNTHYSNTLEKLIEDFQLRSKVRITGAVSFDDLRRLYVACDMFVLPSLADAAPRVIPEAMACGRPVIATNVGGIPTEMKDGESGFLVDPANERQLAEKIKYLIDNPAEAERMGAYGRRLAEEELSPEEMARKLVQVYQEERT
ncbi:MAG TPA: glycosyltransferase family 4 protein [Dehalococcoidia bacterium]|nr:glycosyltransferase family 4 protein [Dehalococcoidia bacterium]